MNVMYMNIRAYVYGTVNMVVYDVDKKDMPLSFVDSAIDGFMFAGVEKTLVRQIHHNFKYTTIVYPTLKMVDALPLWCIQL